MSKIVSFKNENIEKIYDPTCGSGSLLLTVATEVKKYSTISGQEISKTTYNIARMNMIIHGIKYTDFKIRLGDTIKEQNLDIKSSKYDVIVANPPYGVKWDSPQELLNDERFYKYGKIAPKANMEISFLQHIEHYLSDKGIAAILLPVGVLFRTGSENKILSYLIDNQILESVILLPKNMFYSTSIPVVCIVLKKSVSNDGVFLVDATDLYKKEGKQNILTSNNIDKIMDLYGNKKETQISKHISLEEIKENNYNLNINRYIERIKEEEIDIDIIGKEIKENLIKLNDLKENILLDIQNIKKLLE